MPLELDLPADDPQLLEEIERALAPYAEVQQTGLSFDLNQIKLIIEIINGSAGIIASAASVGTFILLLRDRYKRKEQPSRIQIAQLGQPGLPLDQADDATVRRLIGIEDFSKEK
jgi:hypothetical protein